jgi:pimeloyl-ACP methyl ester carboxylesterase
MTELQPEVIDLDGLKIRHARSERPDAETLVLLSPWPESIYAYDPVWNRLAKRFSLLAMDLPGFGQSEGRPELFSAHAAAGVVVRLLSTLGIDSAHAVGPDVGTPVLLWAAVISPSTFSSLTVGGGAATFPLEIDGLLKTFVDAGSVDSFRALAPSDVIAQVLDSIPGYDAPQIVRDDYLASYAGDRFAESVAFVQAYPQDLKALAPKLATLETPVQILVGQDDPYGLVADGQILDGQLKHSRIQILATGHNAWEEDPDGYGDAVIAWASGGYLNI